VKYYPRYPADYADATRSMSLIEHGAYALLLDALYSTEQPLPEDLGALYRICMAVTKPEQASVRSVLRNPALKWTLTPDGWIQQRAWEEIAKWQHKREQMSANGKRGGRPPKDGKVTPIRPSRSQE